MHATPHDDPLPDLHVYVGTYTRHTPEPRGRAEGIHTFRLDRSSGALSLASETHGVINPSFLALDPRRPVLYAVNEATELDGRAGGGVSAFAIERENGRLTFLNQQPSHGTDPCHLSVDSSGQYVLVANYSSGSIAVLPIEDGRLGPAAHTQQHRGSSVDPERQAGPHAHSITLDPTNRFALVADLGLDHVLIYRFDLEHGVLLPHEVGSAQLPPGSGPRHLAFHPGAPYVYVLNEMASTVTTCTWESTSGALRPFQNISTLPDDFAGQCSGADIHVAPSGRYVYASNRGHDSIAIFAVDQMDGSLSALGHTPTQGQMPRNFALDPSGTFLLVANQDSDSIVTFRLDAGSGHLTPTGHVAMVPSPVCLVFEDKDLALSPEVPTETRQRIRRSG